MRKRIPQTSSETCYHATVNMQGRTGRALRIIWNTVRSSDEGHKYGEGGAGSGQVIKRLGGDVLYVSTLSCKISNCASLGQQRREFMREFHWDVKEKKYTEIPDENATGQLGFECKIRAQRSHSGEEQIQWNSRKIFLFAEGGFGASEVGKGALSGAEWERGQCAEGKQRSSIL